MNTPTTFELNQIIENFFKEKGTFSYNNVSSLIKTAYEIGYAKGMETAKFQSSFPTIKALTPSDLKFEAGNGLEWYKTPISSLNATTLEEALKKCQL